MDPPSVNLVWECFVKPKSMSQESKQPYYLSPWDLVRLSTHYIQNGLLFLKPSEAYDRPDFMQTLLEKLKHSLALTLVHFYPLAGRLVTLKKANPKCYSVFVDCNDSPGAKFIYAAVDMTVLDILCPKYVPLVVQSFFDHHKVVNHDGHTQSLLSVKVTELVDGVFIGLSMNHAIGDGSSFWQFFNSWSEIFQAQERNNTNDASSCITNPPILRRWFPEGYGPILNLPFNHPDDFINRYESPSLKERMFHFSSQAMNGLKQKANQEFRTATISSLQSLTALMWRCLTRARRLSRDQETSCNMVANNRARLDPPLPPNYFGNCISTVRAAATVGDILDHDLGWAASKLHDAIANHSDEEIRKWVDEWVKSPYVHHIHDRFCIPTSVMLGSSPRFNKYGAEFGMGKAVTLRSGFASKFDGKIWAHPGREGEGSIDLEVCLITETMNALESDQELISLVS